MPTAQMRKIGFRLDDVVKARQMRRCHRGKAGFHSGLIDARAISHGDEPAGHGAKSSKEDCRAHGLPANEQGNKDATTDQGHQQPRAAVHRAQSLKSKTFEPIKMRFDLGCKCGTLHFGQVNHHPARRISACRQRLVRAETDPRPERCEGEIRITRHITSLVDAERPPPGRKCKILAPGSSVAMPCEIRNVSTLANLRHGSLNDQPRFQKCWGRIGNEELRRGCFGRGYQGGGYVRGQRIAR